MSEEHELAECVFDVDYMTQVLDQTDLVIHKRKVQAARYHNVRKGLVILFSVFAAVGVLLFFLLTVVFPRVLISYPSDITFTKYEHCLHTTCPRANFIFEYLGGGKSCNFKQDIASAALGATRKSFFHRRPHTALQVLSVQPPSSTRASFLRDQYSQSLVGKRLHGPTVIVNTELLRAFDDGQPSSDARVDNAEKPVSALGAWRGSVSRNAARMARHENAGSNPWVPQNTLRLVVDDMKTGNAVDDAAERRLKVQQRLILNEVHASRNNYKRTADKGNTRHDKEVIPITIRRDLRSLTYLCLWTQLLVLLIGPKLAKVVKKSYEYFYPPERRPLLCVKKIIIETRTPEDAINNDVPHVSPTEPVVLRSRMYGGYLSAQVHYAHTRGNVLDAGAQWHIVPAVPSIDGIRVKSRVHLRNDQGYLYVKEGKITLVPDFNGATTFIMHARLVADNEPISYQCTVSFRCVMNDSFLKNTSSGGLALHGAEEASYFTVTRGGPYVITPNASHVRPVVMAVEQLGAGYLTGRSGAELTLERTRTPYAHWNVRVVENKAATSGEKRRDREPMFVNEGMVEIEPTHRGDSSSSSSSKPWKFTVTDVAAGEAEPLRATAEFMLCADGDKWLTTNPRERRFVLAPRVLLLPLDHSASLSHQLWCFRVLSPADISADRECIKVERKVPVQCVSSRPCSLTLCELWDKVHVVHIPGIEAPWNPDDACSKVRGPLVQFRANTFVAPRRSDQWIAICAKRAIGGDASEWPTVVLRAARAGATGVVLNCALCAVDAEEIGHSECSRLPCVFVEDDDKFEQLCGTGRVVKEMLRCAVEGSEKESPPADAGLYTHDERENESLGEDAGSECQSERALRLRPHGSSSESMSDEKHLENAAAIERDNIRHKMPGSGSDSNRAQWTVQDASGQHSTEDALARANGHAFHDKSSASPDAFRSSLFARDCHPLRPSIDHLGRTVNRRVRFGSGAPEALHRTRGRMGSVRTEGLCIMDGDLSSLAPRVAEKNQPLLSPLTTPESGAARKPNERYADFKVENQLLLSPLTTPESGATRKPNERYADFKVEYNIEEIDRHDSDMEGSVYDMNGAVIRRAVLPLLEFYVTIFLFVTSTIILFCILRLGLSTPYWSIGTTSTLECHVEFP
eukprot:GEMP01005519.1.p1 GENE.GEMP01005519.1~~GEMP01005519.1.p1  ORF type:complete len:1142 (+),score=287.80 GEMP01005519.1:32-3457(+)